MVKKSNKARMIKSVILSKHCMWDSFYRNNLVKQIYSLGWSRWWFSKISQKIFVFQSDMMAKSKNLKELIDVVLHGYISNAFCYIDFTYSCLNQTIVTRRIPHLRLYEQSSIRPVKYILSCKKLPLQDAFYNAHRPTIDVFRIS